MIIEYSFFVLLLVGGSLALNFSDKGPLTNLILGEILFVSGFINIVTTICDIIANDEPLG